MRLFKKESETTFSDRILLCIIKQEQTKKMTLVKDDEKETEETEATTRYLQASQKYRKKPSINVDFLEALGDAGKKNKNNTRKLRGICLSRDLMITWNVDYKYYELNQGRKRKISDIQKMSNISFDTELRSLVKTSRNYATI